MRRSLLRCRPPSIKAMPAVSPGAECLRVSEILIKRYSAQILLKNTGIFTNIMQQPNRSARRPKFDFVRVSSTRVRNIK
jgi:hypothetical protein